MKEKIEEDIKEIEFFFNNDYFVNDDWAMIHRNVMFGLEESVDNVLTDYKRVLKENEELKKFITEGITIEPNSPYKNYQLDFLRENFVLVQKVKEILNEINKEYIKQEERFNKHFEKENRDMQDFYIQKEAINIMQELSWVEGNLEELLEGRK